VQSKKQTENEENVKNEFKRKAKDKHD